VKSWTRSGLERGEDQAGGGTHALIEDPVAFADLQLVVIDNHTVWRLSSGQFTLERQNPHLLVMTATPIPRSLALTLYGDLDLSVMDECRRDGSL